MCLLSALVPLLQYHLILKLGDMLGGHRFLYDVTSYVSAVGGLLLHKPQNTGTVFMSALCVCVCVCVCLLSVCVFLSMLSELDSLRSELPLP